jgi:3-oxoacyl-[acyl-carrier protein] reductase
MFRDLQGKNVLITGASSGIGQCVAELFAFYGATVGIHYNQNGDDANALTRKITEKGMCAFSLKVDLLDFSEMTSLVPQFIDKAGGLDILINNAGGVFNHDYFLEMDLESWNKTLALNLTAPFFLAKESYSHMKDHGGGRIINITSIAAKYGGSGKTLHYGAAKNGLEAVTKTLAREGAPHNILVNAIRPGVIDTSFHKKIGRTSIDDRVKTIPLRRAGKPLDIARLCLFLGSSCGDYITGQIYDVTGGD